MGREHDYGFGSIEDIDSELGPAPRATHTMDSAGRMIPVWHPPHFWSSSRILRIFIVALGTVALYKLGAPIGALAMALWATLDEYHLSYITFLQYRLDYERAVAAVAHAPPGRAIGEGG